MPTKQLAYMKRSTKSKKKHWQDNLIIATVSRISTKYLNKTNTHTFFKMQALKIILFSLIFFII